MKKILLVILLFVSLLALAVRFGRQPLANYLLPAPRAGIKILSTPEKMDVFVNNQLVGQTPFEDSQLSPQQYTIKIATSSAKWEGQLQLYSGTLSVVNRDLSKDPTASAGETLTLEKGKGATLISYPPGAEVEVDGRSYGQTPLFIDLSAGEHTFVLAKGNYLKRSIKALVPENFNLTLSVDLALSEVDFATITTESIATTPLVVVKDTPTGFLRVRDKASVSGSEVARVLPGEELVLLEEGTTWHRVRLANGQEGYVSTQYVSKKS